MNLTQFLMQKGSLEGLGLLVAVFLIWIMKGDES